MLKPKRLVNSSEESALYALQEIASGFDYVVHPKVRLADVLPIEKAKLAPEMFHYALKAHFDFTVCDKSHNPLFAVEFDGPLHHDPRQKMRDSKKDTLCDRFDFPILRINEQHLSKRYNKASLLRWIISAWELQKSFLSGQESGSIPLDEDFDPTAIHHPGNTIEEVHPHWIALKSRLELQKLCKRGQLPNSYTCGLRFVDALGNYRGIEWIDVAKDRVIFVESGMKSQRFPLYLGDLFVDLMFILIFDQVSELLAKGVGDVAPYVVERRIAIFHNSLRRGLTAHLRA